MNLQDFSLLKEDDNSYVVGHPKGKSMTVPKRGLSEKAQSLISKLKREQNFDEGGQVAPLEPEKIEEDPSSALEVASIEPTEPLEVEAAPAVASSSPETPGAPGAVVSETPLAAAQPASAQPESSIVPNPAPALNKEKSDIEAGARAEGAAGIETAKAYEDYAKAQSNMPTPQDIFQRHQQADQDLQKAFMSQKLDPDRYLHSMSTGSKIAAGIGMILGGIGSGLTGQPNLAAQAINDAISRDIEAQKNDQTKSMNLWKMNRESTQDETQATLATQNQMLNGVKAKALAASARSQSPMAMARIAPVIAEIDQKIQTNNLIRSSLDSSAQGGFSNADPSILVPHLVKNPEQQKQVYGEIQAAQNTNRMGASIMKSFEDAVKENTVAKTGFGLARTPGSVYALHQSMQPTFADLEGTVRQAAMDNTFKNITPAPGDSEHTVQQKRESLRHYLQSKSAAPVAKGNGLDLNRFKSTSSDPKAQFSPQQMEFYHWAIQNPKDPKAQMTLQKLGVQ